MLSDRHYMRGDNQPERTSVATWLVAAIIAVFVLQILGPGVFDQRMVLTIPALKLGSFWRLFTHAFVHDPNNLLHVMFSAFALYFLGRELVPMLGSRRFLGIFAVATILGGLAWTAVHWGLTNVEFENAYYGATSAVYAMLVIFACFYPAQRITFMAFFVIPVTLRPRNIVLALAGLDILGLLFFELRGHAMPFGYHPSSSAHLGGMAAGWIYFRFLHNANWQIESRGAAAVLPSWMSRTSKPAAVSSARQATPISRGELRAEVDRVLDKINSQGFAALTADEKRLLDEAKDVLSRR